MRKLKKLLELSVTAAVVSLLSAHTLYGQTTLSVGQIERATLSTGDTLEFTFAAGDDFLVYGEENQN